MDSSASTSRSGPPRWMILLSLSWLLAWTSLGADLVPVPQLGLRLARGFQVQLYADTSLADDIYSMTLDVRGDVVVSGPGYIRTLLDENADGVAERAVDFGHP